MASPEQYRVGAQGAPPRPRGEAEAFLTISSRDLTQAEISPTSTLKGELLAIQGPCNISSSSAIGINRKGTIVGHFLDGDGQIRWAFAVSDIKKGKR